MEISLFTSKYAPQSLQDVVGNQDNVKKLSDWLSNWSSVNLSSIPFFWIFLVDSSSKGSKKQNQSFRAALLSGPPGIGKTTTALLACQTIGFDIFELNASDKRNMSSIREALTDCVHSQ